LFGKLAINKKTIYCIDNAEIYSVIMTMMCHITCRVALTWWSRCWRWR